MRIVAGEFKGRTLTGPTKAARPTSDKVREAIFSMLGPIDDARVLDLFAGTGALGIEALSRGAAHATFVEKDRRQADALVINLKAIVADEDRYELIRGDALKRIAALAGPFDLVFIDPPYADAERLGPGLVQALPPGATIVTESDRRSPLDLHPLAMRVERKYGDTLVRIYGSQQ